jgi:hypothetical protein
MILLKNKRREVNEIAPERQNFFVSSFTIAYEVSCRARKEEVSRVISNAAPRFFLPDEKKNFGSPALSLAKQLKRQLFNALNITPYFIISKEKRARKRFFFRKIILPDRDD